MTVDSETDDYQFEFRPDELLVIKLGVHCENAASQPRIRWRIENTGLAGDDATLRVPPNHADFWIPYATEEVGKPRLVFGRDEDPRPAIRPEYRIIDAEDRETMIIPEQLGFDLQNHLEELGTVSSDSERICADPSAFPSIIRDDHVQWESIEQEPVIRDGQTHWKSVEWKPAKWETERRVMWYAPQEKNGIERPYQIEDGELIWREFDARNFDTVAGQEITEKSERKTVDGSGAV